VTLRNFLLENDWGPGLPRKAQTTSSLSNKEKMTFNALKRDKLSRQPRETHEAFPLNLIIMTDWLRTQTWSTFFICTAGKHSINHKF
jgi:hypothetical protein